jgi:hypothetical protein
MLSAMHPEVWMEVSNMARAKGKELQLDFSALIEDIGLEAVLEALGFDRAMQSGGMKKVVKRMDVDWLLANLTPEQRKKLKELLK